MPSMAATQVGWVPEEAELIDDYAHRDRNEVTQVGWVPEEAEQIDDYAHKCARDRDEQDFLNPVTGEGQASIPDPVRACMLVEIHAHGSSATIFALAGALVTGTPHLGEVILVSVFHCFPQVGLVNV